MDRVSYIGTMACLACMFCWFFYMETYYPSAFVKKQPIPPTLASGTTPAIGNNPNSDLTPEPQKATAPPVMSTLENDLLKASLTSLGGGVQEVELKDHTEQGEPLILNKDSWSPILGLRGWLGDPDKMPEFQVTSASKDSVVYTTTLPNQLSWQRTISLNHGSYAMSVQDVVTNNGAKPYILPHYNICLGRSNPLHVGAGQYKSRIADTYLGAAFYGHKKWFLGSDFGMISLSDFNSTWTFFIFPNQPGKFTATSEVTETPPLQWAAAQNQFFAQVLIGGSIDEVLVRCYNHRNQYGDVSQRPKDPDPELETFALFYGGQPLDHNEAYHISYTLYTGPKDYTLLSQLGSTEAELLNYGNFWVLILPMRWCLHFFYHIWGSYGMAIMSLTLLIKLITWPIQTVIFRSGKRMQALAPLLKELQEKYKDQPERLVKEQTALYADYGVNPFSSCWTFLIQPPVFFSLYFLLQTAVELRNTPFLWIKDLTQPDALLSFYWGDTHIVFNLLPVLVTLSMVVMMRLTPLPGSDPMQVKIMQMMPLFYLYIFYQFAAALSLYYVINNSVAIYQNWRNLKRPLPVLTKRPRATTG